MPRLLLLLAVALVLYILLRRASTLPPHKRRAEYIKIGVGVAVIAVVMLTLAGKMHWVGAALTGLLVALRQLAPVLIRLFPMLGSMRGSGGSASGQSSQVNTDILQMHLDHDSGALSGQVLKGKYREWRLDDMSLEQLRELLAFCQSEDAESVQLLEGYLSQRFGDDEDFGTQHQAYADSGHGMTRQEALDILGLKDDASEEDVITAHRRLMQKLHPDRGGNDYLAAKINQAKDLLTA
ncbi:MAG: DnaJ domain-containing protein [Pseudomonadota bacterium]